MLLQLIMLLQVLIVLLGPQLAFCKPYQNEHKQSPPPTQGRAQFINTLSTLIVTLYTLKTLSVKLPETSLKAQA
jgi:hypothetical protein